MTTTKTAWEKFLDFGKGWGLIATLVTGAIAIGVIFETRIFETPEQRHSMIQDWKDSPTPEQKQRAYFMDSLDKASAIKTREKRLAKQLERDSINGVKDSLILDVINKNADQIFQIKEKLKKN